MAKKKDLKKKISVKPHTLYDIKGDTVERKRKNCPKCGPGTFLAQHKNRVTCGKCHYMEKTSSKKSAEETKVSEHDKKSPISDKAKK